MTEIGDRVRDLREARQLSIRNLSDICGLAVNTLSLIENGKTSPSINTLSKISDALDFPITAFFEKDPKKGEIVYIKKSTTKSENFNKGFYYNLGSNSTHYPFGPYLISLEPKSILNQRYISHPGYEFVYCIRGSILFQIIGKKYLLECGDSLLFDSSKPHTCQNDTENPTDILLIMYTVISQDNLIHDHITSP